MTAEEFAQSILNEILEVSQQQAEPATERMSQITNHVLRYYHKWLRSKLETKIKRAVQYGPFAGMQCTTSAVLPQLIGSYEAELHDTIQQLSRRGYERVINIGCGEGYYAVGLARLLPAAHVFALDGNAAAQNVCRALAELNGVAERITIMGKCTPAVLQDLLRPGALIFCDCEGDELQLLDPVAVPELLTCDILVEMHDFLAPHTSSTLVNRFRPTHETRVIEQSSRDPLNYPVLESLNEFERLFALCEFRPGPTPWGLLLASKSAD
jgi:ribosomal protein L11 methylase PrmA